MSDQFVHLHTHTVYSLLDGYSNIKKLVKKAKDMNMPALAITDHGTMFGAVEFYNAANDAGVKPIIGVETYMAARGMQDRDSKLDKKSTHLLLLAENEVGYKNLLKITSAAQMDGFYYFPRIDHEFLAQHSDGLIATTGCMGAEIPRSLLNENPEEAVRRMNWYYDVFGPDRFYVELQHHNIAEITDLNRQLVEMGAKYSAKFVATNDIHYIEPDDAKYQDILLAIQTGKLLDDPDRMRYESQTFYMRSPQEMADLFSEIPSALSNTVEIAERCNVDLSKKGYHLPIFPVPDDMTDDEYLRSLVEQGLEIRYGNKKYDAVIRERMEYELGVIGKMGFNAYFLIVWDLCRYARENGIWYNTRGSGAGSLIAYSLFITLVDPIKNNLLFERFLNPDRASMPDIDLDFRDDRRTEMFEYTARKYGDDKVAQIITFGTMGAKGSVRDVGRVMDIPLKEVDAIAKLIPDKAENLEAVLQESVELRKEYNSNPQVKTLIDNAIHMEGVVRNAGTHAAGLVISDLPITEYIPIHRPTSNNENAPIKTVTQFEMKVLDDMGMLKVDFLGLSTITVMAKACDMIKARHGVELNLDNIPTDDPDSFLTISQGHTAGIFQLEGEGMTKSVVEMKPTTLDHIIAMVALYRPGPMDFIPSYIRRMHGEEEIVYRHPAMEPIFSDTYGIAVYQEQIMRAAVDLAGYTRGESDDLRKAISKKMADKIAKHKEKFIHGASQKIMDEATARAIFEDWEKFARYGFNKSHAADYGLISVQTAYLKTHYTPEYMSALMSVFKNVQEKITAYIAESKSLGINVLPPDVRYSDHDFTIEVSADEDGKEITSVRFGLGAIKNVGAHPTDVIVTCREGKPFKDINDFCNRVDLKNVGKRALESLIKVGAMDGFGDRAELLANLDRLLNISASHFKAADSGQMSLFGAATNVEVSAITLSGDLKIDKKEALAWEKELIGFYVSDHPLSEHAHILDQVSSHNAITLQEITIKQPVRVAGVVSDIRAIRTKKDQDMAFVQIEDLQGYIELVVFPRTWSKYKALCGSGKVIIVDGDAEANGANIKVLVTQIRTEIDLTTLEEMPEKAPQPPTRFDPFQNDPYYDDGFGGGGDYDPNFYPEENSDPIPQSVAVDPEPVNKKLVEPEPMPEAPVDQPIIEPAEAPEPIVIHYDTGTNQAVNNLDEEPNIAQTYRTIISESSASKLVIVDFKPSGDADRDRRRIRNAFLLFTAKHGSDKFQFSIRENSETYRMEFPNESTKVDEELISKINKLLGEGCCRIEELAS